MRAEKLTSGLASEGIRWHESVQTLGKQKVGSLVGSIRFLIEQLTLSAVVRSAPYCRSNGSARCARRQIELRKKGRKGLGHTTTSTTTVLNDDVDVRMGG